MERQRGECSAMGPRGSALSTWMLVFVPASVDLFVAMLWNTWGAWEASLLAVVLSRRSDGRFETVLLEGLLESLEKVLDDTM